MELKLWVSQYIAKPLFKFTRAPKDSGYNGANKRRAQPPKDEVHRARLRSQKAPSSASEKIVGKHGPLHGSRE
jgi:hypothetical protein